VLERLTGRLRRAARRAGRRLGLAAREVGRVAMAAAAAGLAMVRAAALAAVRAVARPTARLGRRALLGWRRTTPPVVFVTSFLALIAIGTAGFLFLPLYTGPGLDPIDALFTATSAACVTGLIVVDTATYFTIWGQLWILLLIQLGGIGLITLTTLIIGALGGRVSIRAELTGLPGRPRGEAGSLWQLAGAIARFTLLVEAAGAALLFLLWLRWFSPGEAMWHAIFHSVSAFCNAGFSTFSDSLEGFRGDAPSLMVVSILVVTGGIGYLALRETWAFWRRGRRAGRRPRLSTHTFAALVTTGGLLAFGTVFYLAFEWRGVLGGLPPHDQLSNAWFMSVTARTAGFNSVPYGELGNAGGFLTILLMFIGGSPGSTAGGLKTTTLAVLVGLAWSRIHARQRAAIHGRDVPAETLERTVSLTLLALLVLTVSFFLMTAITAAPASAAESREAFLPMAFEVVSAFATVGLSMGTTPELGSGGELLIIALMFIGRVGLFSFFSAVLLRRRRAPAYRLASEDLIVG
jgi:trk system potassium uptake protein